MGLKKFRIKKGLIQKEVAENLGIDRSTVAKWETGQSLPRAELLPKIAELLDCTVDDLLREDKKEHK